jgi:hypothetical protein
MEMVEKVVLSVLEQALSGEKVPWWAKAAMLTAWKWPGLLPGEGIPEEVLNVAIEEHETPTTSVDVVLLEIFRKSRPAGIFRALKEAQVRDLGGLNWVQVALSDLLFLAGGLPEDEAALIRDSAILEYSEALNLVFPGKLGVRISIDYVSTLTIDRRKPLLEDLLLKLADFEAGDFAGSALAISRRVFGPESLVVGSIARTQAMRCVASNDVINGLQWISLVPHFTDFDGFIRNFPFSSLLTACHSLAGCSALQDRLTPASSSLFSFALAWNSPDLSSRVHSLPLCPDHFWSVALDSFKDSASLLRFSELQAIAHVAILRGRVLPDWLALGLAAAALRP